MSLLCGCAGKTGSSTPTHSAKTNMSKLRPPSSTQNGNGRFGFSRKSQNVGSKSTESGLAAESNSSTLTPHPQTALSVGLALDPSALLSSNTNDNFGGYVARNGDLKNRGRPASSIVSVSQSSGLPSGVSDIKSYDDTNPSGKPKSGLRSFFSRQFSKEKPTSSKVLKLASTNSRNINSSKSEGNISGLARPSSKTSLSGVSGAANTVSSSRSSIVGATSTGSNSSAPTSGIASPAAKQNVFYTRPKSEHRTVASSSHKSVSHSKPVRAPSPRTVVPSASKGTGVTKYSSKLKPKSSKLAQPSSQQAAVPRSNAAKPSSNVPSSNAATKHSPNCITNDCKQLHNNSAIDSEQYKESVNIDLKSSMNDVAIEEPAADTDINTKPSSTAIDSSSITCADRKVSSSLRNSASLSTSTASTIREKKKPTIEINPLTKEDGAGDSKSERSNSMEQSEVTSKKRPTSSSSRTYTLDAETLTSIMSEMNSLKNTIIELQHHLIGKQEYEEKMREELELKNEIIANLQNELARYPQRTGYRKMSQEELLTVEQ